MKQNVNELTCKHFLECLLDLDTEIDEQKTELAFWQRKRKRETCLSGEQDIERRVAELELRIRDVTERKLFATRLIDTLEDPVARAILRRRYILGDTWTDVAQGCGGMSSRNARYIHDHALFAFEKIFCEAQPSA